MKTTIPILTAIVLAGLAIRAVNPVVQAAPPVFKPTWSGDDHDQPVYTSPAKDLPKPDNWAHTNIPPLPPGLTNWPVTNLPPITNWATTNLPPMTNPPPLHPPGNR